MNEQPMWRLTQAQIQACWDYDPGQSAEGYNIALCNAQAKRLMEWGLALCTEHEASEDTMLTGYLSRVECDECLKQLRKEVGLD